MAIPSLSASYVILALTTPSFSAIYMILVVGLAASERRMDDALVDDHEYAAYRSNTSCLIPMTQSLYQSFTPAVQRWLLCGVFGEASDEELPLLSSSIGSAKGSDGPC